MLDDKDLQAIKEIVDNAEKRICQTADRLPPVQEPLTLRTRVDALEEEVRLLKFSVLQMAEDLIKLKEAKKQQTAP